MKKQRTFTPAFKAKVAMDAIKGVKTIEKISSEYEVHTTQVNKWKTHGQKNFSLVFEKTDVDQIQKLKEEKAESEKKLYEQIGRLQVENDFLKKNLIN